MNSKVYVRTSDAPIMIFHGRLRFFYKKTGRFRYPILFFFKQQTRKNESIHKQDLFGI